MSKINEITVSISVDGKSHSHLRIFREPKHHTLYSYHWGDGDFGKYPSMRSGLDIPLTTEAGVIKTVAFVIEDVLDAFRD